MRRGVVYDPCDAEPKLTHPAKNVDEAPCGIGKLAAAAAAALQTSVAAPSHTTHADVMRSNAAWPLDPLAWAKRQAATKVLEQQTARIADALLRAGVNVTLDGDVTMIGAVTGVVEHQRVYRAVRFLPTVAGRDRRPIVNGLKLWMAGHQSNRYFRYAVMTCAAPVPVGGNLREAIQNLSRRISKWSHEVWKRYGIKVLFRGIEFTRKTAEERGMTDRYAPGTILYHVHANILYWPTRNIAERWPEFLRHTHSFIGAEWKDNGKVGKIEEIVKYCSKPADTLAASDDELVWLYENTRRLKICQPLGDFKAWMQKLEAAGEKVVRVHVGRGDGRLRRVLKRGRKAPEPKDEWLEKRQAEQATDEAATSPESDGKGDVPARKKKETRETSPSNVVLGLTLPQWRHTPWSEPLIMVQRYDPSKPFGEGAADIEAWKARARQDWDDNWGPEPQEALRVAQMARDAIVSTDDIREAAEAAPYIVHTCRPSVRDEEDEVGHGDDQVLPEELDDDLREIAALFAGGTVVRLRPRPTDAADEIPFESPLIEACGAKMRAQIDASAAGLLARRAA